MQLQMNKHPCCFSTGTTADGVELTATRPRQCIVQNTHRTYYLPPKAKQKPNHIAQQIICRAIEQALRPEHCPLQNTFPIPAGGEASRRSFRVLHRPSAKTIGTLSSISRQPLTSHVYHEKAKHEPHPISMHRCHAQDASLSKPHRRR